MASRGANSGGTTTGGVVGGILGVRGEIANPTPGNPTGQIGRAVCDTLSSVGYDNIPFNNRTGPGFVCEPYWDDAGIDPPQDVPPFTGGQCAGVPYNVTVEWTRVSPFCQQDVRTEVVVNVVGPIEGIAYPNPADVYGCSLDTSPFLVLNHGVGGTTNFALGSSSGRPLSQDASIVSVSRADGQPDNCGDPPPDSVPGPVNPGIPYGQPRPLPGFPGVEIIVDGPEVTEGDDYYIPVTITNDDGDPVGPPIFWTPDGNPPDFPPPPDPPTTPGTPQEPGSPAGDVTDDISPDEEEDGVETIGYEWSLTGLPSNLSFVPGTSPQVLTTPYGNVQLRYEDSTGVTRYSDNLPIRVASGSIVRQDSSLKVKGVRYSRRPDVGGIRLTPLRSQRI